MKMFYVTKIATDANIARFVEILNQRTHSGYIAAQTRVGRKNWLLRVACICRDDANFVRNL